MSMNRGKQAALESDAEIILIGDARLATRVLRSDARVRVRIFRSFEECRDRLHHNDEEVVLGRKALDVALSSAGMAAESIPTTLRTVLERAARRAGLASTADLYESYSSRRTFFRHWSTTMPESPRTFLDRLRAAYAAELVRSGMAVADVLRTTRFSSLGELTRALRRYGLMR